ncbi:MAG: 6-bladed beta-propeller [Gemmatimonadota bacterium]|nr:6-bladed beta-propeller [Gemmatimonadota bacterium]MDE2873229.1 6-bladed beta-propeller [Gemmatimonadota bacterium]
MKIVRALAGAVMLLLATESQVAGQVIQGPWGPVEFIGLQRWDAQELFDAVRELDPGRPFHACAAVMKQDLGFADAAAFLYVGGRSADSERYTVVVGVEDSVGVRYRPAGSETVSLPENWEKLKAIVGEDVRTLAAAARTLPARGGFFRRIFNGPRRLAERMGADPETLDLVWDLVDSAAGTRDRRLAHEVLARDSSSSARAVATLVLGNFIGDDTSWHALAGSLIDSGTRVRTAAQGMLEGLITRDRDPVDWSGARAHVLALFGGTNPFAFGDLLEVLVATGVDPEFGQQMVRESPDLLLAHAGAAHEPTREPAVAFLRTVSGEDHGADIEAWRAWVRGGLDRPRGRQVVSSVADSAGIRITTSDVAGRDAGTVCPLAEVPYVRIASASSDEWTLYRIEDLDRMEDGRIVVLNRGSQELLMFGRAGEFLRSVGRRGEGPGEFMDAIELDFAAGDSIVVWDWHLGRLVLFGPDGSHGRSFRLRPPPVNPTGRVGVLGRHSIAIGNHDVRSFETELAAQFLQVLRYDWNGTLLDTLATLPYGELGMVDRRARMMGSPLFEAKGVFSTHGELLYASDGSSPEVRLLRRGRLESVVRWDPGDLSVRKEDMETYRAAWLKRNGDSPLSRRRLDAFPAKDVFPAVREIQIDAQGRIWIRTYAKPGSTATEWLGFGKRGEFVCSLSVPRALTVFHFDSAAVAGVHRDDMDVESVQVRSFVFPR